LAGIREGKIPLGKTVFGSGDNIKINYKEMGHVYCINRVQDIDQWWTISNTQLKNELS
jgi:hypothetical protein